VLLQVGFFVVFRRREPVGIEVEQIAWNTQGLAVTLPHSKTDRAWEEGKAISFGGGHCCAAPALRGWLVIDGLVSGPVYLSSPIAVHWAPRT